MASEFSLREMQPSDGPALAQLMENDPETPGMALTTRFLVDTYQAWLTLKPTLVGVVAEAPGIEGLVGAATVSFENLQFDGRNLPSAFLENLKVHHAYRGHGLGSKLAQWRIDKARERFGDDGIILTGTTSDNTASLATMKKWCKQFIGPLVLSARPPRTKAPKAPAGLRVQTPDQRHLSETADKANRFYADYNLYWVHSAEQLDEMLKITPQVYHYRVVVDSSGSIVAGALLEERSRLMVDEFRNVPPPLRLINRFTHMLPADNLLRMVEVGFLWFEQLEAARYLWEHIRWEFRDRASVISSSFDARSPLKDVFRVKPWHMPKIQIMVAVNGPTMMDTEKLVANTLRG